MADIPSSIPSEIRAGDTAKWRRQLGDYPANDGWALAYTLVGATSAHGFNAAADGEVHLVTLDATTTAAWAPGPYRLTEYVSRTGERYTLSSINVRVLPDLASATTGTDTRTHARKVLDAIEAWLESKAPVAGEMQLGDRRIRNYDINDLLALRDRYLAEVRREELAAQGLGGRRLLVRC